MRTCPTLLSRYTQPARRLHVHLGMRLEFEWVCNTGSEAGTMSIKRTMFFGAPVTCSLLSPLQSVTVRHLQDEQTVSSEPLAFTLPLDADHVDLTLHFHGHYREPPLQLPFRTSEGSKVIHMSFDIIKGTWLVQ